MSSPRQARPWASAARATAQGPQIPGAPNILYTAQQELFWCVFFGLAQVLS